MRKALWLFIGMISAALFSTTAVAAPWNAPINVRIVQKSNTDNARVFSTIQAALSSITDASATNPYMIKVMPGIYDLGGESLQMQEYVTLSGSGESTKIINADIPGVGNSAITDLSIDSSNVGISNAQGTMTLRNLDLANTPVGISGANVDLDNVRLTISVDGYSNGTWAITCSGVNSKISIKNSAITVNDLNGGVVIANTDSASVEIDSTTITINTGGNFAYGVYRVKSVSNSKVIVNSSQQFSAAFNIYGPIKVYNTYVEAATPFFYTGPGGPLMCANVYDANLAGICP